MVYCSVFICLYRIYTYLLTYLLTPWFNGLLGGLKIMNSILVTLIERRFAHNHSNTNFNRPTKLLTPLIMKYFFKRWFTYNSQPNQLCGLGHI